MSGDGCATSAQPEWDHSVLSSFDHDLHQQVLREFLVEAATNILSIQRAVDNWNDASSDAFAAAHRLKGASGVVGAKRLHAACSEMNAVRHTRCDEVQGAALARAVVCAYTDTVLKCGVDDHCDGVAKKAL